MSMTSDIQVSFDTDFFNIINNELVDTSSKRRTICSSTKQPLKFEVPVATKEDVDRAVDYAAKAYPSWSKLSWDKRAEYLFKFADAIEANKDGFIKLLSLEAGKPPQAAAFEMALVIGLARQIPLLRIKEDRPIDDEERTAIVRYVPLGVGVGIIPWNFPLTLGIGKLLPALLAGNTFIWKPSPFTPHGALKLAEIGAKIFPPGVFQALSGDDSLGPWLTSHPGVAKVSFTGSVETGKRIMASCAGTLKRVTLELGGNDAAVICDDVDIPSVVNSVAFLSFVHSGQICMAIKRIYVHEKIYDQFLAEMVKQVKTFKMGDRSDPEAFFGPVQNEMQYEKVKSLYAKIGAEGWKAAVGGEIKDSEGFFLPATIIDNPPDDSEIVQHEPFGPIVPVLKWSDEEDVIRRVNDTKLGLGASVWSSDVPRAQRMAEQLEAGSIWVNTHFELAPSVPFGGHKESGIGMDWGEVGLKGWCNPQAYWVKHLKPKSANL
ncbi:aldehyde dehydrogenase [Xylaria bambusicola]|uniref:aldehyde dehydrogenase n=1 Tax=Xylaria bambusicola TaxID=326684 RepID=UPI00200807C7|nr:aldehyde dehydrogenase [Xylaria bambusicola]KAI0512939.1 aldehyde dehydrogenase [Xylaria bambusicola]